MCILSVLAGIVMCPVYHVYTLLQTLLPIRSGSNRHDNLTHHYAQSRGTAFIYLDSMNWMEVRYLLRCLSGFGSTEALPRPEVFPVKLRTDERKRAHDRLSFKSRWFQIGRA